jgi:hypothetical protein
MQDYKNLLTIYKLICQKNLNKRNPHNKPCTQSKSSLTDPTLPTSLMYILISKKGISFR